MYVFSAIFVGKIIFRETHWLELYPFKKFETMRRIVWLSLMMVVAPLFVWGGGYGTSEADPEPHPD